MARCGTVVALYKYICFYLFLHFRLQLPNDFSSKLEGGFEKSLMTLGSGRNKSKPSILLRTLRVTLVGETGPMLDTFRIFAIFRKIFVGIHFWYMLWMRLVHRYTLIFFKIFCGKICLKTVFQIFDISGHYWGHIGQKPVPCWTEPLWPVKIKEKFWKNSGI